MAKKKKKPVSPHVEQVARAVNSEEMGISLDILTEVIDGLFQCWKKRHNVDPDNVQSSVAAECQDEEDRARLLSNTARRVRTISHKRGKKLTKEQSFDAARRIMDETLAPQNAGLVGAMAREAYSLEESDE